MRPKGHDPDPSMGFARPGLPQMLYQLKSSLGTFQIYDQSPNG